VAVVSGGDGSCLPEPGTERDDCWAVSLSDMGLWAGLLLNLHNLTEQ
jgi:hypothetical protein